MSTLTLCVAVFVGYLVGRFIAGTILRRRREAEWDRRIARRYK